jgi:hypothetical protein
MKKPRRHLLVTLDEPFSSGEDGGEHFWLGKNSRRQLLRVPLKEELARRGEKSFIRRQLPLKRKKSQNGPTFNNPKRCYGHGPL